MRADSADEEGLITRYRGGDAAAFDALFRGHEPELRAFVDRRLPRDVRRRVAVSDVVQETRIVAFARRADFEPRGDGAFRRWLLGIAERTALGAAGRHRGAGKRSVGREARTGAGRSVSAVADVAPSPSEAAAQSEALSLVRVAMDALPGDQREVLRLVHVQGLTLAAAAAEMARTRSATRRLYGHAVAALGAELRRRGAVTSVR